MTTKRSLGFIAAALMTAGSTTALCCREALARPLQDGDAVAAATPSRIGPIDLLERAQPWLAPQGAPTLRGKVVLVNFWTYSCINSLRALPYLRAWSDRYGDKGLQVVGVHAPEFGFEHDPAKVRSAVAALGIGYPNLQDNDYAIWSAFANEGWPGFYFIDAKGQVRAYRVGEGDYDQAEQLLRKLLTEAGHDVSGVPLASITGPGIEAEADWRNLKSPEAYLGYAKAAAFASPGGFERDAAHRYVPARALPLNRWNLSGDWSVGPEFAVSGGSDGAIRFRFHARDAHFVLGAPAGGKPVRFRVTIDGAAPGADHGADTDAAGWGELRQDRLYQIVRQHGAVTDRTVRIEFSQPGVRAYSVTFG